MSRSRGGAEIRYGSRRSDGSGADLTLRYEVGSEVGPSQPETLDHFLLERYLLYVERGSRLVRGQVHHPPYPVCRARLLDLDDGLVAAGGLEQPSRPPDEVHFSDGVDVELFRPEIIERT